MIKTMIMMMTSTTLMFCMVNHPLTMGLILLLQTLLISLTTGIMSTFWFSYILFMIMIGGMLVLFIYMTSIASNEKFVYTNTLMMMMTSMLIFTALILATDSMPEQLMAKSFTTVSYMNSMNFSLSLSKYLNIPTSSIMLSMIIYLLITLIAVVKITNITYGPLRQKS